MGDIGIVYIEGAVCAVYVHWNGRELLEWLKTARMPRDPDYATARLIGHLHVLIQVGGLSVLPPPSGVSDSDLRAYSHGDAGVLTVNDAGVIRAHGGYYCGKKLGTVEWL